MRLSQKPPTLLSLLLVVLSHTENVRAGPYPKDNLHDVGFSYLQDRDCASYCGTDNQYCCTQGQACYTNAADIAYCSGTTGVIAASGYAVYTTTWTETDLVLRTSTYSSYYQATSTYAAAPTATVVTTPAICTSAGETSCGVICCASNQYCAVSGQCAARTSSWTYVATATATAATSSYSAPLRPTSGTATTATVSVSATTTGTFLPVATASGSSVPVVTTSGKGLSAGAIAGIVIGVLAGILLLLLLCFCCIIKAGFDGLLAIFGLGKKKRRSTERVETVERYSRHGSGTASRRETHGGWFGASRPSRVTETRKKKSGGFGGLGAVGAGLVGLAVILGLKRQRDRKEKPERSDISSSYYTDSYTGTSAST